MKYELKFIHPLPVLKIAGLISPILGLVMSLFTFFVFPSPALATAPWSQKLLGIGAFILIYTLVVTVSMLFVAFLYNFLAGRVRGLTFHLDQLE